MRQHARPPLPVHEGTVICKLALDCIVHDVSEGGACLEFSAPPTQLPDAFEIVIKPSSRKQRCTVAWRKRNRIGVAFKT
jgi:PilZ domain